MKGLIRCPRCGSPDVLFSKKRRNYICEDCREAFAPQEEFQPLRIFLSYGHDEHASLARRLKADLARRGHEVWFDEDRIKVGSDWERYIEEGLEWVATEKASGRIVLLMTPHSVRRPDGYCLNELSRALGRSLPIIPVMVVWSEPPLSICRIQWLDMQDCLPLDARLERYEWRFTQLAEALEHSRLDFDGNQSRLLRMLAPLPFDADVARLLHGFTGRRWVFDRIDEWLADPSASRVFWITGSPGVGKSAIAVWLCTNRRDVAAFHLCRHGHVQKADPRRCVLSIAYQLSSQLPDYRDRLSALDLEALVPESDARTLFDGLLVQPLAGNIPRPDQIALVLIDALDEASSEGRNELASFLAAEFEKLPTWLRLIITSRPDPEVTHPLQALTPWVLDAEAEENRQDLMEYLRRELPAGRDEPSRAAAHAAIVERSEGCFLYVDWVRRELAEGRLSLDRPIEFPQGLGGVYAQFFHRQCPDGAAYAARLRPALEVMAAAKEPLSVAQLRAVLNWDDYAVVAVQHALGSLLTMTDGFLRPFHSSVVNWLVEPSKAGPYFVSVAAGNSRLADWCWRSFCESELEIDAYVRSHLPRHLIDDQRWDELAALLTSLRFLKAKVEAGQVFELAEDFALAVEGIAANHPQRRILVLLQEAIRRDIHFIARHPETLFQCLWNNCWWYDCPAAEPYYEPSPVGPPIGAAPWGQAGDKLHNLLERWLDEMNRQRQGEHWCRSLRPPPLPLGCGQVAVLRGHRGGVNDVVFSPDGKRLASASDDKTIRVWHASAGKQLMRLHGHEQRVVALVFGQGESLVSGSLDGTVRTWDLRRPQQAQSYSLGGDWVTALAGVPARKRLASGTNGSQLRVWDDQQELLHWKADSSIIDLSLSNSGEHVAVVTKEGAIHILGVATNSVLCSIRERRERFSSVAFLIDRNVVAAGSESGAIALYHLETGAIASHWSAHAKSINSLACSPDGKLLGSASHDNSVSIWNLETQSLHQRFVGHENIVHRVAFSNYDTRLATASADETVRIWNTAECAATPVIIGHREVIRSIRLSPLGDVYATSADDHLILLWDADTGEPLATLEGHTGMVRCIDFSPDGQLLASGSEDQIIRIWNLRTWQEETCLSGHEDGIRSVAFDPDGERLVSCSFDDTIRIWDLASGEETTCLHHQDEMLKAVWFSGNGATLECVTFDGVSRVLDMKKGKVLDERDAASGEVADESRTDQWQVRTSRTKNETQIIDISSASRIGSTLGLRSPVADPQRDNFAGVAGKDFHLFRVEQFGTNTS